MVGESAEVVGAGVGGGSSSNKMPTLEEYGTNLTKLVEEGKLDPVVGRQEQIERVTQIPSVLLKKTLALEVFECNMARGKDYTLALYLKAQFEYERMNHQKAIKLLVALINQAETGISSIFLNNLGCIYHRIGKFHTSTVLFSKALSSSSYLRKEKVKKVDIGPDLAGMEEFDWMEGLAHWSNFLKYKEVFGDMPALFSSSDSMTAIQECNDKLDFEVSGHGVDIVEFGDLGHPAVDEFAHGLDGVENEVLGLEFDYGGEECEDTNNEFHRSTSFVKDGGVTEATGSDGRKKRKLLKGMEAKAWGFLAKQLVQLREMESRFEQREADRDGDRTRREILSLEIEQERERKWEQREPEREEREKCRETSRRQRIQEQCICICDYEQCIPEVIL